MSTDDKPSIAELQRSAAYAAGHGTDERHLIRAREQLEAATPVLLEIAAAALARMEALDSEDIRDVFAAKDRLRAALSKVRP